VRCAHALRCRPPGYIPPGDKYAGQEKIKLLVRSELVRAQTRTKTQSPERALRCAGAPRTALRAAARPDGCGRTRACVASSALTHHRVRIAILRCLSAQHLDEEYGGPFYIEVSPKMKVEDLRIVIRVRGAFLRCTGAIMRLH
jgi:hypothetical protein